MSDPTALCEEKARPLEALVRLLRLRIVRGLLKCGCRNVGYMRANTGQSQSCIPQHLTRLRVTEVVKAARPGNEVYYEIANPEVVAVLFVPFGDRGEEYQYTILR